MGEIDHWDSTFSIKSLQAVDIYSSGFVLYDILTGGSMYRKMQEMFGMATAVNLDSKHENPLVSTVDYMEIAELASAIHSCLSANLEDRPNIKQLRTQLQELSPLLSPELNQYKLFDKIYQRLCQHSNRLEREVTARSRALRDAKRRCDVLIQQFLPKEIVDKLRTGQCVDPELFDCVTILFTQLDGFGDFARAASPGEIFALISRTEDFLDVLSVVREVYKVESVMDSVLHRECAAMDCREEYISVACPQHF
ncbi:receptor-type guanylate cyclase gcy-22-like [Paramacrobiotus metropolitanus]|uniref:receptor-type guanylate cyclase gcy-22-like n=1 Tax=Paramacrobiotus metropolitanus TaxID=2943436 RepID=UPI002445DE7B|nr:receptor-type guanylate cyclase gcy-22-like [Paramacrobiotus metropolitanus]